MCVPLVPHCNNIEKIIDESALSLANQSNDFGYIKFDEIGNITLEINNNYFRSNSLISEVSYIGVWVFPKNADINLNCCTGSSSVCGVASNSCVAGVGFSQDLGFLGSRYIFKQPPQLFNKYATKHYISVKAADNSGIPMDYQGDYILFSAPTNPVQDRQQYDLYVGIYYNLFEEGTLRIRPINLSAAIGKQTYYTRISPDLISPKISIEAKFYRTSINDIAGTTYVIPRIEAWRQSPSLDTELDKRGNIRINEVGNAIDGNSTNDFIELYNPTDFEIPLDDVFIQRFSSFDCAELGSATQKEDLSGLAIQPKSFITYARSGNTLSNITKTFKTNSGITISSSDCIALTKGTSSIKSPTDAKVIDFVGFQDSASTNKYLGTGTASQLFDESAVSRCPDGADSRNNSEDFYIEVPTPGLANTCSFSAQAESITKAQVGDLLISEVLYSGTTNLGIEGTAPTPYCLDTGADDFVEIVNNSSKTYNLGGSRLQYISSSGSVSSYYTFSSFNLAPGEYVAVVSQDAGCYTASTLSGRKTFFRSSASATSPFNFSGSGATIALTTTSNALPTQSVTGAIDSGTNKVLDYVGWLANGKVYSGSLAPNCNPDATSRSSMRRKTNTQNTNNNGNDFECGISNGTPGRSE